MDYSNPELPEGINTGKENPLKEFAILTSGVVGSIFLVITLLIFVVDNFADKIPFEVEQRLPVSGLIEEQNIEPLPHYLEALSQKVIDSLGLPEPMQITVHYLNSDTVNAFATLGGHIVLYRGLLEKLTYEDELAMIIAHEVSHIKHRHPIMNASHGIVVGLVLSLVGASSGNDVVSKLLGTTGMVTMMKYSRDNEQQADRDAVNSLIKIYGNAEGALALFKVLDSEHGDRGTVEFFNTHPLNKNRSAEAQTLINEIGTEQSMGRAHIPAAFRKWLQKQKQNAREQPQDQ
ncbi:MAG: M48 family metallopeptidase [Gammaproteobacteria bacterium]|nr:M48 family metallopeptidase [Gammaproteobacteria bacterium]